MDWLQVFVVVTLAGSWLALHDNRQTISRCQVVFRRNAAARHLYAELATGFRLKRKQARRAR
jgi:hypothetical protein